MSKERFKFLVAVHAFFLKDSKVLLLERCNTGYMDGYFSVPAGHVDGGEEIADAVKREIREEVGIDLKNSLQPAHVMHRMKADEERIDYFFVIDEWQGSPVNSEPDKCSQLKWFSVNKLPQKIIPYVKFGLEKVLKGNHFSEFEE